MKNPTSANPNMADNLLFQHFATLATAPDGIARLRELILQLAVQGKLGTQDAGDEPASVLQERIKAEKKQLINDGKIRQEQPLEHLENNGLQNNLPDKWRLSKLGDYCLVIMGQSPESKYYNEHGSGLPFYQGKTEFGKLFPKPKVWCENPLKIAQKNDILISVRAPVGPTNICPSESCIGRGLTALRSLSGTSHFFLMYSLRAHEKLIAEMGVGSTFSAISKKDLDNFVIAVPPLAEQHRIVAKVDRLMALCDELEARQQQERAGCLKLGTAILAGLQNVESPEEFERLWVQVCDAFDLILDCPENVAMLRQTIIDLALKGSLTRSLHKDSNVKSVIEEIAHLREHQWMDWKKERAGSLSRSKKKTNGYKKPYEVKTPPYILPKGWQWITISEISFQDVGLAYKSEEYVDNGIRLLRGENVKPGKIDWKNTEYYPFSSSIGPEHLYLNEDEIVLGMDRPIISSGLRIARISKTDLPSLLVQRVMRFRLVKKEMIDYLNLCLSDERFKRSLCASGMTGAQLPHITGDSVPRYPIPFPPLAEQHRIVAKVDALMALCDELEARLKERAGVQGRLAGAVVKGIAKV